MKTCSKCQTPKILDEFVKDKRRSDGRGSWCITCNREYMRAIVKTPKVSASRARYYDVNKALLNAQSRARWAIKKGVYRKAAKKWREEHRSDLLTYFKDRGEEHRSFLNALKEGVLCADCGLTFPPYVMEYDHVRGVKRFGLGKMANHRREAVLAEIEKCELVCCACHRVRTQARNTHGNHQWKYGTWSSARLTSFHSWIDELKANPCKDCGKVLAPEAMDFDHIYGEKKVGISSMWSWGRERVLVELAKCELVCANCHRTRTQNRRSARRIA